MLPALVALALASAAFVASANVGCAMSCADNSPGSSCMSSRSAWQAEPGSTGSAGTGGQARRYGAIAVSPSTLTYGFSYQFPSRRQAEDAALTYCHGNATKPRDCKVSVWFWNQCASLALQPRSGRSPGHWGAAWAGRREAARTQALAACRKAGGTDCKAVVAFCS